MAQALWLRVQIMSENVSSPAAAAGGERLPSEPSLDKDGLDKHALASILRRFIRLGGGYWRSEQKVAAISMTAAMFGLAVVQILIQVWLNFWNKSFFDALERKDWTTFSHELLFFGLIVASSVICTSTHLFVKRKLQFGWRAWLSNQSVERWVTGGRQYQLQFMPGNHDNADGRIAEDIRISTELAVEFANSIFYCSLLLVSFLGILWTLSGIVTLNEGGSFVLNVPGYMVWIALAYAAVGTTITFALGRPLVAATDLRQTKEADFRFGLVRTRENAEGIALLRGEADERRHLLSAFTGIHGAWDRQTQGLRRLIMLTNGYGTLAAIVPIVVAAPRYFAGSIALGGLMQTAQAFVQVQSAMSWFVDNFPRFAEWSASAERVLDLHEALDELDEDVKESGDYAIILNENSEAALQLHGLHIAHPDGTVLLNNAEATINQGERVLIKGESGTGKSTLLRAVAGLWPWGRGEIKLPPGRIMFMPQRPYLPIGRLRGILVYPDAWETRTDEELKAALLRVGLDKLVDRLDDDERWDQTLSGGEQQRVAFARLLLHKPDWIFLDEATAALDEDNQTKMMTILAEDLGHAGVVSIGHRPGLETFHQRELILVPGEDGATLTRRARGWREELRQQRDKRRLRRERILRTLSIGVVEGRKARPFATGGDD